MNNSIRKQIIARNEVSEIREFNLGGYRQKVLIDGKSKSNPIVIILHGGPGSPIPFSVGCRGMFPEITEKLTMVCWDQLGCGINNRSIDDSFSIRDYAEMTEDLVKSIRELFPENKILLFGVSWGSILTLKASISCGEHIHKAIAYGQVVRELTFNEEVFNALINSKMPERRKAELRRIYSVRSLDSMKKIMGWIRRYTEGYQAKGDNNPDMAKTILGLLKSPDYKFKDFRAVIYNGTMKNRSLLEELLKINLTNRLSEIKVPYTVIQGDKDIVTSTKTAAETIAACGNPNVSLITLKDSGHMPGAKGMQTIISELMRL